MSHVVSPSGRRPGRMAVVAVSAAVSVLVPLAPHAVAAPPPARDEDRAGGVGRDHGDHLLVRVRDAGGGRDGTYEVFCHPGGGSHPDVAGACQGLDRQTRWGRDLFAPVPEGSMCTMQYGGPATAHVTGTWAGRPVNATYDRRDGCEIARWDRMVPLLPDLRPVGRS
ncbi:SSI family serine proteinase inhibitor [Streptomyces sp. 7R007]